MENVRVINKNLKEKYGSYHDGRPKWQLVWSDGLVEKRLTEKEEYFGSIYVGFQTKYEEVKKYSYLKERWILERLIFSPMPQLPESGRGHYEPWFVFQDKNGNYLKPLWKVIDIIVNYAMTKKIERKNQIITDREEQEAEDAEVLKFMDELRQEAPPFDGRLSPGAHEGVAYGGVKRYE